MGKIEPPTDHESSFTEIALNSPSHTGIERGEQIHNGHKTSDRRRRNMILVVVALLLIMGIGMGFGIFMLVKANNSTRSGLGIHVTATTT